ncbi:MAG: ATP-binding protein [Myxococcaceae bacterium]
MADRLVSLRVQGFRCLEDVTVRLDGLQLFIGENGTGKSTLVEAGSPTTSSPDTVTFGSSSGVRPNRCD